MSDVITPPPKPPEIKYIREARFGPPKCFKTGSVLMSYPTPMLVFMFDSEGESILPNGAYVKMTPAELLTWISNPESLKSVPNRLIVSFTHIPTEDMVETYMPVKDGVTFVNIMRIVNYITKMNGFPFKLIVLDSTTALNKAIESHMAATNPSYLADPRKWAPAISMKVLEVVQRLHTIKCHNVVIMHDATPEINDVTKAIVNEPAIYASLRQQVSGYFSQFFYQCMENGVPTLFTKDQAYVKKIGARWPANLPEKIPMPTYKAVYETDYTPKKA